MAGCVCRDRKVMGVEVATEIRKEMGIAIGVEMGSKLGMQKRYR